MALGRLGAFETLSGIDAPLDRCLFWAVTLVLGYLGYALDAAMPQVSIIDLLSGERHAPVPSHRVSLVPDLLRQRMGFAANDAREWASIYQRECLRRFEPDPPTPSSAPTLYN